MLFVVPNSGGAPELNQIYLETWSDSARQSSAAVRASTKKTAPRATAPAATGKSTLGAVKSTLSGIQSTAKSNASNAAKDVQNATKAARAAQTAFTNHLNQTYADRQKAQLATDKARTKQDFALAKTSGSTKASTKLTPDQATTWHQLNDQIMNMSSQLTQLDAAGRRNSPLFAVLQQKVNTLSAQRDAISTKKPARPTTLAPYVKPQIPVQHVVHSVVHHNAPGKQKSTRG